jgi:hypothetical protein
MFKTTIINIALSLLSRIPWDEVISIIQQQFQRKVNPALLAKIDELVEYVDRMDLPGEEKFRWVFDSVRAEDSPVKAAALGTSKYLLETAIQVSVTALRARLGM